MTKQKAIKEAWEKLGISVNDNVINQNGWMNIQPIQYERLYDRVDILRLTDHVHRIRPKSLKGIENNNGWIDSKDMSKIPDEYCYCWLLTKDGDIILRECNPDAEGFYGWREVEFTHYQPIIKPEKPIY